MKILLTGATGYIGKRLLPVLVANEHEVVCGVRDESRFDPPESLRPHIRIIEIDLLDAESLKNIPKDIDAAYYLVHSMSASKDYADLEKKSALNFRNAVSAIDAKHVIYLSGIVNEDKLSDHLSSRKAVEDELAKGEYAFTALRAGIIIGSGSASFEIIRDLVEKLPIMITPKWLNTKCQPIGVKDVIRFLSAALFNEACYNADFDIGGPDVFTYKEMLYGYAKVRNLKRAIYTVPVMTPRLSSYWLYFVTSTSYKLAVALVDSMKVEVVCRDSRINEILDIRPKSYEASLKRAFDKIESNAVVSGWQDSLVSGRMNFQVSDFINVPTHGCFKDERTRLLEDKAGTVNKLMQIGGTNGWYYANFLWRFRGFIDKLFGGVGLRRGRTNKSLIQPGDALDFWRVLYVDNIQGRLLLFAEMKLPGEAWLEFKIEENQLVQTATFRPKGLWGRLYWYSVFPFHGIVFRGMIKRLAEPA